MDCLERNVLSSRQNWGSVSHNFSWQTVPQPSTGSGKGSVSNNCTLWLALYTALRSTESKADFKLTYATWRGFWNSRCRSDKIQREESENSMQQLSSYNPAISSRASICTCLTSSSGPSVSQLSSSTPIRIHKVKINTGCHPSSETFIWTTSWVSVSEASSWSMTTWNWPLTL